jgi:hypothetical protein
MSNVTKTVKLKESHLVDLIDNIVNEVVSLKKQEWLNEQATKQNDKTTVLENKLGLLEAKINKLTETKK